MSEHITTVGENIKRLRNEKGITQRELANRIQKSYSSIQKYEMDIAVPPISVIEQIADALGVDKFEVIGWNCVAMETLETEKSSAANTAEPVDPKEEHLISNYRSLDAGKQNSLIDYSDYLKNQM